MYIFVCEDSMTGIFTGVYDAWASGHPHEENQLTTDKNWNLDLFAQHTEVVPDEEKAEKVMRTLRRRLGEAVYSRLCYATMAASPDKSDAIYHTIVGALKMRNGTYVFQNLQNAWVMKTFELSRMVSREISHLYGFIRFRELANGVMLARYASKHRSTLAVTEHFVNRFPMENFILLNETYHEAVLHRAGSRWQDSIVCDSRELEQNILFHVSEEEQEFEALWCAYFDSMTIEARKNPKLQQQMFPKRYWKHSVELQGQ